MSTFTQVGSSTNLPSSRFTSPEQEAYTNGESALKEAENKVHNLVEVIRSDRNAPVDSDLYPMPYNVTYSLPLLGLLLEEEGSKLHYKA